MTDQWGTTQVPDKQGAAQTPPEVHSFRLPCVPAREAVHSDAAHGGAEAARESDCWSSWWHPEEPYHQRSAPRAVPLWWLAWLLHDPSAKWTLASVKSVIPLGSQSLIETW